MYYYVVNPASGGGRINKIQEKLRTLLKEKGISGEFVKTTGKGDAVKVAKMAIRQGYTTIVAVGGDSTVSEVANGLIDAKGVVLGMLPIGTTNILSGALGISDWAEGVNILAQRRVKTIDLGKVNDYFFATSLEIGFETEIMKDRYNFSALKALFYRKKILDKLFKFKPFKAKVEFDNKFSIETDIFNISVFNSRYSPNKKEIFLNDGKLTAVLVSSQPKWSFLKNISKITKSYYEELPFVSKFRAKKIVIDTGKNPQKIFADGGYLDTTPVEVSVSSKKLKVIVSKERKFD